MPRTVCLSEIAAALQFGDVTNVAYFNRTTGHLVTPTESSEAGGLTQPQTANARAGLEPLPVFTEEDEIELARQFVATVENAEDQQRLRSALSNPNPRDAFETTLFRCRIANEWFQVRNERLLRLAKEWLETHGVPYTDDGTRRAD